MEEAKTVAELFSAWSDLANIQSMVDEDKEAYEPDGLARDLREVRLQLMGDLQQAFGLLPESNKKVGIMESAEKLLVNELVSRFRKKALLRELDLFEAASKSMGEIRKFIAEHIHSRGTSIRENRGKDVKRCYACGRLGHMSYECRGNGKGKDSAGKGKGQNWMWGGNHGKGGETSGQGQEQGQ